jgi:hypothetical protein
LARAIERRRTTTRSRASRYCCFSRRGSAIGSATIAKNWRNPSWPQKVPPHGSDSGPRHSICGSRNSLAQPPPASRVDERGSVSHRHRLPRRARARRVSPDAVRGGRAQRHASATASLLGWARAIELLPNRGTTGVDDEPQPSELGGVLAGDLARGGVAREVIQRMSGVGDLKASVATACRPEKSAGHAGSSARGAVHRVGRPSRSAPPIASAGFSAIACEQIEHATCSVEQDLAVPRGLRLDRGGAGRRRPWPAASDGCGRRWIRRRTRRRGR